MTNPNDTHQEMAAYDKGPYQDLTYQDALTIITICAAQMDPEDCQQDIRRAAKIILKHPEFEGCEEGISNRLNMYVNSMQVVTPQHALVLAADVLKNSEAKRSAFELAVKVAMTGKVLAEEKKAVLETIADKLHIDQDFMQRLVQELTSVHPRT